MAVILPANILAMLRLLSISISEALRTLRGNLLHTLLSTLGIVIGVAALIAILALGDGMEQYGREQVSSTTDLSTVMIIPNTREEVDGMTMEKDNIITFSLEDATDLSARVKDSADIMLQCDFRAYLQLVGDTLRKPAQIIASLPRPLAEKQEIAFGQVFTATEMNARDSVVVLNHMLAMRFAPDSNLAALIGKKLDLGGRQLRVLGILKAREKENMPMAHIPIFVLNPSEFKKNTPNMALVAHKVEDVSQLKARTEQWLDSRFKGGKTQFRVFTNDFRLEQLRQAILIFKIVMGMIVGIAILVGGIGVMNVLLMSVTERTREIGVRKALGAKRKTIAMQFLAESLAVSLLGCLFGILLGMFFMMAAVPIIKHFTEVDFHIAFKPASFMVVVIVAIMIGIIFGTYPAWKASKLSPVDAIRHE